MIRKGKVLILLCLVLTLLFSCGRSRDGPVYIKSISINGVAAEVETSKKDGKMLYVISVTLPSDTDFKRCMTNIELLPDAKVSMDNPCIVEDMGGSLVLNLTLQNRGLTVLCGDDSQFYSFKIDLQ